MTNIDDVDRIFRIFDEMMRKNFSGGYATSRDYSNDFLDIFEDDDYIYITLELNVQEEDIEVEAQHTKVVLEIMSEGKWSKKGINLPSIVNPKTAKISYNRGILDIELEKVEDNEENNI